ncbi:MAG: hypothetical protein NVSMB2_27800 [Chloroflexota bacterium]
MKSRAAVRKGSNADGHDGQDAIAWSVAFAALALAVSSGRTQPLDDANRRRQPRLRQGPARQIALGIKVIAEPRAQLVLATLITLRLRATGTPGARAVFAAVAAAVLADKGVKRVLERTRPPGYRGKETEQSFPSGHTAATAALTVSTMRLLVRRGSVRASHGMLGAVLFTALVAESRMLLDEHWLSDVLAGAVLGSAAACGVISFVDG